MSWIQQSTDKGIYFQQDDGDRLICSIECSVHLQNTLHVIFANDACAERFIDSLKLNVKIKKMSTGVNIIFPSNASILNSIIRAFSQIESIPSELIDAIYNAFNLNAYQRLQEIREIFLTRVHLMSQLLEEADKTQHGLSTNHELAAEILECMPKDSIHKLQQENSKLEKFLYSSPLERKLAKEKEQATKVVCFSKASPTNTLSQKIVTPHPKRSKAAVLHAQTSPTINAGAVTHPASDLLIYSKPAMSEIPKTSAGVCNALHHENISDVLAVKQSPGIQSPESETVLEPPKNKVEQAEVVSLTALSILKRHGRCAFGT